MKPPNQKKPEPTRHSWVFRISLSIVSIITLAMVGVIIWLVETQNLNDVYTILGIIASSVTVVGGPLIFFSTISKWPGSGQPQAPHSPLLPQVQASEMASALPSSTVETAQTTQVWNVPYRRNPFFTGRQHLIKQLHDKLTISKAAALTQPQAISGLGGIGKTQIAIEYAYSYRDAYQTVLWASAATRETLIADFMSMATLLHLPEQTIIDQQAIVIAVKDWLVARNDWLLILDNVDDLELASQFIPPGGKGHILLTTRIQATGSLADAIEVDKMTMEEGILFLLQRAKRISHNEFFQTIPRTERTQAKAIVEAVDGLPLAIDQAGAYIEENNCTLSSYLKIYQQRQADLLKRRGKPHSDYPDSVATTWTLSFEQVEHANSAAADLLRFCAFLAPDAIPEQMIVEGASELSLSLQPIGSDSSLLDEAIGTLRRFSLIRRNPQDGLLSIHRLVQAVLKERLDEEAQHYWASQAVRVLDQVFPQVTYENWPRCQLYLPHVQIGVAFVTQYDLLFREAANLLFKAGHYLRERGQYAQAELLMKQALNIYELVVGAEHPETAMVLSRLGLLYHTKGRYAEAEQLHQRSLAIFEKVLGSEHPETAYGLSNLAEAYRAQGQYAEAEPLYQRALAIREKVLGPEHPDTALVLNNLGTLYYMQGKYDKAEPFYLRALTICDQVLRPDHPYTSTILDSLARLRIDQGHYAEAEPLMRRAVSLREKVLGTKHPYLARSLGSLAKIYCAQGHYAEAEPLMRRAMTICENVLGFEHPYTLPILSDQAELYKAQGRFSEAEASYQRALATYDKLPTRNNHELISLLENYARFLKEDKRDKEATQLQMRAAAIRANLAR